MLARRARQVDAGLARQVLAVLRRGRGVKPVGTAVRGARLQARPVHGHRVRRGVRPQHPRPRQGVARATARAVRGRHGRSRQPEPRPLGHRAGAGARRTSQASATVDMDGQQRVRTAASSGRVAATPPQCCWS